MDRAAALATHLRRRGVTDVLTDSTSRSIHSSDASLYRVPPLLVARPRSAEDVATAIELCARHEIPLTARGGGTSVAGNAVGPGLLLDFSRHMNRVLRVDAGTRTAVVQPGVVQAALQLAAAPYGLRFGPDPSTYTRCTIGGMIGNNACGSRTLGYGRTSDNVAGLKAVAGDGTALDLPAEHGPAALRELARANLATIRTEFGRFGRQMSGYALEHLLPENGFDVARLLVGSEGTLAVLTEATVALVTDPAYRALVVLGHADIAAAGDAAPAVLEHRPTACEGIDARIVDVVRRRRGAQAVPPLPRGAAWLFVEVAGDDEAEVLERAGRVAAGGVDALIVTDRARAAALWRIREDGAGLSGRSPAGLPAHAGWEDAAVPPAMLGRYLRDFESLMAGHGVTGLPYGHFGDGCLHIRLDVPLDRPGGRKVFRDFLVAAATLVAGYGGSLSGEHGDGRARSELLPLMYSEAALDLFARVKAIFDPGDVLNPGVLVRPRPLDADLRIPAARPAPGPLALAYRHDGGDFGQAVHRCTGVGKCRADNAATGGVMCPSYLATKEEKDSTRGRARALQEMLNGSAVSGGWRSPEVHEALDLCLSCKGCASDCPTGIDMAAYKSEVLYQSYRGRPRPAAHYSLGRLPLWARLAGRMPRAVNAALRTPALRRPALALAGVDPRRTLPAFARQTFRAWFNRSRRPASGEPVLLFVDTFTDHFAPEVGRATVAVLEAAGYRPRISARRQCCALTWISTGQLDAAKKILGRTVAELAEAAGAGVPIVGMEPSCTAVLRSDALELVDAAAAAPVAHMTRTLAELLSETPGWEPPALSGAPVVAQPHCHHHAVMSWDQDARLLREAGAEVRRLGGCCGLAGNFGVEKGHYEVSVAVAEHQLLPALRQAGPETTVLADGFSCRTQITDLSPRQGIHLAQLLADRLP
ncbi:FAD-binding and (Fe-S)-binding domain-containing protein [Nonomuraea basaltis]|uniref:FAD-binding and (Fe-S)-binding domain-containing protein n=1 Tax=Nonomuraea basaltis TaxID=2495887 RepID=UPI00110C63FE|nr:FAD-binding and (Fe-S)-binding domain-containing protein [Nonomuraea basaltis]TMR99835.1 FAD-binding oxidoreductase [Nonomuraea basaltis]